jgi:hypothetical protein
MRFQDDKYDHTIFATNNIMDTNPLPDSPAENRIESKREIIRQCLDEIIVVVESRLRAAGLSSTIFLTVPYSGDSVLTMATPSDPSDELWSHIVKIVCEIVSERLNGLKLRGREMVCAMANSTMVAADVTAD